MGVLFVPEVSWSFVGLLWIFGFSVWAIFLGAGCLPRLFARFSCPLHVGFHSVLPSFGFGSELSFWIAGCWKHFCQVCDSRPFFWYRVIYVGISPLRGLFHIVALPTPFVILRLVLVALESLRFESKSEMCASANRVEYCGFS